jgi:hypothetical protein
LFDEGFAGTGIGGLQAAEEAIPVAGMHIAFPSMGALEKTSATAYRFTPFSE